MPTLEDIREIRPHGHNNLAGWIINLLFDLLLCSISENFAHCLYFDSPNRLVKIRHNS